MARVFAAGQRGEFAGAALTAKPITMACWVKPTTSLATAVAMALSSQVTSNRYYLLGMLASNQAFAEEQGSAVGSATGPAGTIADGAWGHLAATFAIGATGLRTAYCNGVAGATNNTSIATPPTPNRTTLGGFITTAPSTYGGQFLGRICEAAIWNVVLNAAEIAALAADVDPRMIRPGNLVGYWPVYGTGSPERDFSVGQRHLTLTGPPAQAAHAPVMPMPPIGAGGYAGATYSPPPTVLPPRIAFSSGAGGIKYVSPTGSNANPGSEASPYLDINHALQQVTAGGEVVMLPGNYLAQQVWQTAAAGTAADPKTVRTRDGLGTVVIDRSLGGPSTRALDVQGNVHHIRFQNLHFRGSPGTDTGTWVHAGSTDIEFLRCWAYENGQSNWYQDTDRIHYINCVAHSSSFTNRDATHNLDHGFYISGNDNVMANCVSYDNDAFGMQLYGFGNRNLVINCLFDGNGRSGVIISGFDARLKANWSRIVNCIATNNGDASHPSPKGWGFESNFFAGSDGQDNQVIGCLTFGNLTGSASNTVGASTTFTNVVDDDPEFVDQPNNDYRISSTSPAVDQGLVSWNVTFDFDDAARDASPDIGPFEFVSTGVTDTPTPGGALAQGAQPGALAASVAGGAVARGTQPTARTVVVQGGALAQGTGPAASASVTPVPGQAVAQGVPPALRAQTGAGGATALGSGPTVRATFLPGGALAQGAPPSGQSTATATTGGAFANGSPPVCRVSVGVGGALAAGSSPSPMVASNTGGATAQGVPATVRVSVTAGGAVAGGAGPGESSAVEETPGPGGAAAAGTGPAARTSISAGGALARGSGPAARTVSVAGGGTARGLSPVVRVSVVPGGAAAGGFGLSVPVGPITWVDYSGPLVLSLDSSSASLTVEPVSRSLAVVGVERSMVSPAV